MAKLPVIDLAKLSYSHEKQNLLEASRHWGCFHVINHGIAASLQSEMKAAVRALSDLPIDIKRRNVDVAYRSGYVGPTAKSPPHEAFGIYDAASQTDVDTFCSQIDAPKHIRETIKTYAEESHKQITDIATKLAEKMGLNDQNFGEWQCQLRLNKYSFTKDLVGSDGFQIHTDSGLLTLLQADESVGGLEILDPVSGSFVEVDPLPGTLLVNLGDAAKVWSNGVLHNIKHRVQCKAATPRISIAFFLLAPKDDIVEAPAAFIDSDHPRMYKTFKLTDYQKIRLSTGLRAGEALPMLLM